MKSVGLYDLATQYIKNENLKENKTKDEIKFLVNKIYLLADIPSIISKKMVDDAKSGKFTMYFSKDRFYPNISSRITDVIYFYSVMQIINSFKGKYEFNPCRISYSKNVNPFIISWENKNLNNNLLLYLKCLLQFLPIVLIPFIKFDFSSIENVLMNITGVLVFIPMYWLFLFYIFCFVSESYFPTLKTENYKEYLSRTNDIYKYMNCKFWESVSNLTDSDLEYLKNIFVYEENIKEIKNWVRKSIND